MKANVLCNKLLCLCIGLALILSPIGILGTTLTAFAEGTDLALYQMANVNGQISDEEDASKAVDGDDTTKWCNITDRVNWLMMEFGRPTTFDTWVIKTASFGGESWAYDVRQIIIQVSDDMQQWKSVSCVINDSSEENQKGLVCGKLAEPVSASFVRLYIPYGSQYFPSEVRIYSFELYHGDYTCETWAQEFDGQANTLTAQQSTAAVKIGESLALNSLITRSVEGGEITWCTMETDLVDLNPLTGAVKGKQSGTAYITGTASDGGSTVNLEITVSDQTVENPVEDLALNARAYASGSVGEREAPDMAVDGDDKTKWCDNSANMEKWLMLDLKRDTTFDTWVVKNAGYGGETVGFNTASIVLQTSSDRQNWATVDCLVNSNYSIIERKLAQPVTARYVRLYIPHPQQPGKDGEISIGAARIYGFELYNGGYTPMDSWKDGYSGENNQLTAKNETVHAEIGDTIELKSLIEATTDGEVTFCTEQTGILSVDNVAGTATVQGKGIAYLSAIATDGGDTVNILFIGAIESELEKVIDAIDAIGALDENNYKEKLTLIETAELNYDTLLYTFGESAANLVTNHDKLMSARSEYDRISALVRDRAIDSLIAAISGLGEITQSNYTEKEDALLAAEQLRDALIEEYGEAIESEITNLEDLMEARAAFDEYSKVKLGDVNNDTEINASDALMILQHCVNLTTLKDNERLAADVSGEGDITTYDALLVLQYTVDLIDRFPAEQ